MLQLERAAIRRQGGGQRAAEVQGVDLRGKASEMDQGGGFASRAAVSVSRMQRHQLAVVIQSKQGESINPLVIKVGHSDSRSISWTVR